MSMNQCKLSKYRFIIYNSILMQSHVFFCSISSTEILEPVEPRKKVVVQGDSFIRTLLGKPSKTGYERNF